MSTGRHKLTFVLLAVVALLVIFLTTSPTVSARYYLWQLERHSAAISGTALNPSPTDQQVSASFAYVDYYQEKLVALGYYTKNEYVLEHLKGDFTAFSQLHGDFVQANASRTASAISYAPHGTLVIHDLAENRPIWDKFVAEHSTTEFAEGKQTLATPIN